MDLSEAHHDEVEVSKSSNSALIGGVVGGIAGVLLLVVVLYGIWRTRGASKGSSLPITRPASSMRKSNSNETGQIQDMENDVIRPPRGYGMGRSSTMSSWKYSTTATSAVDPNQMTPGRSTPLTASDEK